MKLKNKVLIFTPFLLGLFLLLVNSCDKEEDPNVLSKVTTSTVIDITPTSASCGGEVINDGGASVTDRGICWGTSVNPTISDSKTIDGNGKGLFTSFITGLTENTTYYIRAYATNSEGTAYGNEQRFSSQDIVLSAVTTSIVIDITPTTALCGGEILNDGGASVTERGVCWGTSVNPTISDSKTSDGNGNGLFTSFITGLTENTTYYIRAYATNSEGTAYGNELSFKSQAIGSPTVTTVTIIDITAISATCGGNVTNDGEGIITERGVCYSTTVNPTIASTKIISIGTTGVFSCSISGLTYNTIYYVRSFATNSAGTSYGNELSFVTLNQPTIITAGVINITTTTATCGGEVTSDGGLNVTERGICYSTDQNPTIENTKIVATGTIGLFTSNLINLTNNITYYIRAYATNSAGTAYGNEVSFTSQDIVIPSVTTSLITDILISTALSGGDITSDGAGEITERGICFSTSQNPTTTNNKIIATGTTGAFTSQITELTGNTTYYLKAYATNSAGTAYGSEVSFKTYVAIDGDGNGYYSVIIGAQEWLVENLKTTKYNDGSDITPVTGNAEWAALTTPGFCFYENDATTNKATYGALYNFYTIDPSSNGNKSIAPVGWHVATIQDWANLRNYLDANGFNYDGSSSSGYNIAKAICAVTNWTASSTTGAVGNTDYPAMRNITGFNGLPGGIRDFDGVYEYINETGIWWTSYNVDAEQGWGPYIGSGATSLFEWYRDKNLGLSVRCVKD